VRSGDEHLLVDCGATSLTALKAQGIDPGSVTGVVISHLHGDHFGGLPFLILDGQFRRGTAPLTVLGRRAPVSGSGPRWKCYSPPPAPWSAVSRSRCSS